jgi:hypothetical protein
MMEWWKVKQKMRYINPYNKLFYKTYRIIISLTKLINKLVSLHISILLCVLEKRARGETFSTPMNIL